MDKYDKNSSMRRLQLVDLEILTFFDKICRENKLTYYLAYGTLLGAVRHGGFIPWDDDVDVWMPRDDFMKLLDYLKSANADECFGLSDGEYKVQGDRPAEFQMRIIDKKNKISRRFAGKDTIMYPWIDVFCLDIFPEDKKGAYFREFKKNLFIYKVARCKTFLIEGNSLFCKANKLVYTLHNKFHMFRHVLNEDKRVKKVAQTLTKYQDKAGKEYSEYFCYAAVYLQQPQKCFFPRAWFAEPERVMFEGREFYAPRNKDAILTTLYNDYWQLPPEEQRRCTHDAHFV